jgi:hypothetical protein
VPDPFGVSGPEQRIPPLNKTASPASRVVSADTLFDGPPRSVRRGATAIVRTRLTVDVICLRRGNERSDAEEQRVEMEMAHRLTPYPIALVAGEYSGALLTWCSAPVQKGEPSRGAQMAH